MTEIEQDGDGEQRLIAHYSPTGKALKCVAWSPDGAKLAVGSDDNTVRILTPEGTELASLSGHFDLVWSVAFSPDGHRIASGVNYETIRLWDSENGAELFHLKVNSREDLYVLSVAFSPNSCSLASGSSDNTIRLWDTETGAELGQFIGHDDRVRGVAFSPDGRTLASGSDDETIRLWSIETGTEYIRLIGHADWVRSVAFSPNGRRLVSGSKDQTIRLWDAETGAELAKLIGHKADVNSVAFSPDGRLLASGADDKTIRLWDAVTGVELACLINHTNWVWSVAFSPDGHRLASASADHKLCIWDTSGLVQAVAPSLAASDPLALWLTRQAVSLGRAAVFELPPAPDVWVPHLEGEDGQGVLGVIRAENPNFFAGGVALSRDGRRLYSGFSDGRILAWNLTNGTLLWSAHQHTSIIQDLALSPNGGLLASGSRDNTIRLWDAETGIELTCLTGHEDDVGSVAFSPDGCRLASGSFDNTIRLWDVETGIELACLTGHEDCVMSVAFSPDGCCLASGSNDKTIRRWDVETRIELACFSGHKHEVKSVAFSPDGRRLASGSADNTIRMWDAETGVELSYFVAHEGLVSCVAFSPDGRRLASGGGKKDKTIRLWDVNTGVEIQRFAFPEDYCWRIAWAPSDAFLVAGLKGDTVRIYDTRTPEMLGAATTPRSVSPAANPQQKTPLPIAWAQLPETWTTLHRLNIAEPLSLLHELRELLAGNSPEAMQSLLPQPGLRALHGLRWPERARTGLLALLLHGWPGGAEWQPPPNVNSEELRRALAEALTGSPCTPTPPAPPVAWLSQTLERVDDRLLTLLTALGHEAVAADPGLPLRLLPLIGQLPSLTQPQRQLLGLRLAALEAGSAQGSGTGQDRSGFAAHGAITALVPSQWAYPRNLLRWRHLNGGLLYRTRTGREPPQLRPMVILLDTSPACWGLIEALTRPAAHALAEALARQHRPAVLLTGGDNQVHYLDQPAERLQLLTHRSRQPVDIPAALARAQALRSQLSDSAIEPVVVLLTHCWWGADLERPAHQAGLRALFVQYPGSEIRPPYAACCERWESVRHNQFSAVAGALGRLIG